MPRALPNQNAKCINDVAQLLSRVVDIESTQHQADELIEEISQLLWLITDLDPEGEQLLKHSAYISDFVAQPSD